MAESEEVSGPPYEGLKLSLNPIPDYQFEGLQTLTERNVKLFRITILVVGVYAAGFTFVLEFGRTAVVTLFKNTGVVIGVLSLLFSLGCSMTGYFYASHKINNSIKASEYLEMQDRYAPMSVSGRSDEAMTYHDYWRRIPLFEEAIKRSHMLTLISMGLAYFGAVYTPLGFLDLWLEIPSWIIIVIPNAPLVFAAVTSSLLISRESSRVEITQKE